MSYATGYPPASGAWAAVGPAQHYGYQQPAAAYGYANPQVAAAQQQYAVDAAAQQQQQWALYRQHQEYAAYTAAAATAAAAAAHYAPAPTEAPPPLPDEPSSAAVVEEASTPPPPGEDSAASTTTRTAYAVLAPAHYQPQPGASPAATVASAAPGYDAAAAAAYQAYYGQPPPYQAAYADYAQQQQQQYAHHQAYAAQQQQQQQLAEQAVQQHAAQLQAAQQQYYYPSQQQPAAAPPPSASSAAAAAAAAAASPGGAAPPTNGYGAQQPIAFAQSAYAAKRAAAAQRRPSDTAVSHSYSAVPPPTSLAASQAPPVVRKPGFAGPVKPQMAHQFTKPGQPAIPGPAPPPNPPPAGAPAYTRAAAPAAGRPAAAAPARTAAPAKYPPSFGAWVERCFASCRTDAQRQQMTAHLSKKIKDCESQGRMWSIEWDTEPLPAEAGAGAAAAARPPPPRSSAAEAPGSSGRPNGKRDRWGDENGSDDRGYDRDYERDSRHRGASPSRGAAQGRSSGGRGDGEVPSWRSNIGNGHAAPGRGGAAAAAKQTKKQKQAALAAAVKAGAAQQRAAAAGSPAQWTGAETSKLNARAGRFGDGRADGTTPSRPSASWRQQQSSDDDESSEEIDFSTITIRGTCRELEKSFFRLTDAPDPSSVRPEVVLTQALQRLVAMLRRKEATYFYALDQFKGMRQDCTVQHLRNSLAVQVYEAHARSSLEYGDAAEFNQCQTQLHAMYADGAQGCRAEFVAYKLLYQTVHARRGLNKALLATMQLVALDPTLAQAPEVIHALQVRSAVMSADNLLFFRLYATAPNMGRALLDSLAIKVRWIALNVTLRAYKSPSGQNLPVPFLAHLLGFVRAPGAGVAPAPPPAESLAGCSEAVYEGRAAPAASDAEGWQACLDWLRLCNVALVAAGNSPGAAEVDTKVAVDLTLPVEAAKVAHGDENLSMEDFLSKVAQRVTAA